MNFSFLNILQRVFLTANIRLFVCSEVDWINIAKLKRWTALIIDFERSFILQPDGDEKLWSQSLTIDIANDIVILKSFTVEDFDAIHWVTRLRAWVSVSYWELNWFVWELNGVVFICLQIELIYWLSLVQKDVSLSLIVIVWVHKNGDRTVDELMNIFYETIRIILESYDFSRHQMNWSRVACRV